MTGDRGLESLRRAAAAFVRAADHSGGRFACWTPSRPRHPRLRHRRLPTRLPSGRPPSPRGPCSLPTATTTTAPATTRRPGWSASSVVPAADADVAAVEAGVRRGARLAESVALARDLVNEPPSSLTPEQFADALRRPVRLGRRSVASRCGTRSASPPSASGGLLGVARGSTQPPRLVRVEYRPPTPSEVDGRVPHLALVGKGITFDSGGLSLKTATGMETMKTDMGGAAAVLCAVDAAAALGCPDPHHRHRPADREHARRIGDQARRRAHHPQRQDHRGAQHRRRGPAGAGRRPDAGRRGRSPTPSSTWPPSPGRRSWPWARRSRRSSGTTSSSSPRCERAGERAGEPLWPLPLPDDYRSHIDSEVADMRNIGRPGQAGSIAAATAAPRVRGRRCPGPTSTSPGRRGPMTTSRYLAKGGTGFGVRTLVALVTSESSPPRWRIGTVASGGRAVDPPPWTAPA